MSFARIRRVLVLGSEGTLGTALCKYLNREKDIDVVRWDIKMGEEYDLRKPNNLDDILPSVDFVFFLAFDVGGAKYNVFHKKYIDDNIALMQNTFASLAKHGTPFIHTTSQMSNMFGNPYGVLKCLCDFYVQYLDGVNVRLWNVYDDEEIGLKSHVIPDFIYQALTKQKILMRSDGTDERQFLYSDDFADAMYHIMRHYKQYQTAKQIIDLTSFQWVTINDIAHLIQNIIQDHFADTISIEVSNVSGNNQTCKNEPSASLFHSMWQPKISLRDGVERIVMRQMEALRERAHALNHMTN